MSLRRYDVQATYAFKLAVLSIVPLIAVIVLTLRNYEGDLAQIVYGSKKYLLVHHACLILALVPSFAAVALGWSSAGERRNDRQRKSWIGFFVGGSVFTVALILGIAFYMLRLEQRPMQVGRATHAIHISLAC